MYFFCFFLGVANALISSYENLIDLDEAESFRTFCVEEEKKRIECEKRLLKKKGSLDKEMHKVISLYIYIYTFAIIIL
jgi:hypothetical protein